MFLLVEGTNAEHRTGSPLALATMADAYNIRIGGYFDAQGTTRAMRGSRHSSPPSSAWARLQQGSYQSDPLFSIVLLALRSLGGRIGGAPGRCGGGLAKQMSGNVENGEASTLLREGFEVRLDENLDGLFAGVDLDTDSLVAEVDFVASSVLSSNDGVRHRCLALGDRGPGQATVVRSAPQADSLRNSRLEPYGPLDQGS